VPDPPGALVPTSATLLWSVASPSQTGGLRAATLVLGAFPWVSSEELCAAVEHLTKPPEPPHTADFGPAESCVGQVTARSGGLLTAALHHPYMGTRPTLPER
jgi:hypothetical protein